MARIKLFIGGIHGVGKGSLCKKLVEAYLCEYVSASALLNWNKKSKQVQDVSRNQKILAELLAEKTSGDSSYIIDGHFALWDESNCCKVVPLETFTSLGLNGIVLITCSADIVQERLSERDGISYDINRILDLQNAEILQAEQVAQSLNIPLFVFDATQPIDYEVVLTQIDKLMKKYTRDNIYSEMLKTVIIRLDFSGVINIGPFVEKIKQSERIKSKFGLFNEIAQRQVNVNFIPKDIEDGGLPIAKAQNNTIYRFSKWKPVNSSDAILDIDNSSMTLSVDCGTNHYKGSTEYSTLMIGLMEELRNHDQYISFNRLGVRKIDIQILNDGEQVADYFNEKFTVSNSWELWPPKDMATLTELLRIEDVRFNVIQRIEPIKIKDEKQIRLIFDVDSYIYDDVDALRDKNCEQIESYLNVKMQDKMFDMFVNVASEKYLVSCKKAKENIDG